MNLFTYKCKILRVVDGDTVDVSIDLGFDISINQRVRLMGIDAPETRTRDHVEKHFGIQAKERLEELLTEECYVETVLEKEKFGRVLGIFYTLGLVNINETLVNERLAVKYEGQSKDAINEKHLQNFEALSKIN